MLVAVPVAVLVAELELVAVLVSELVDVPVLELLLELLLVPVLVLVAVAVAVAVGEGTQAPKSSVAFATAVQLPSGKYPNNVSSGRTPTAPQSYDRTATGLPGLLLNAYVFVPTRVLLPHRTANTARDVSRGVVVPEHTRLHTDAAAAAAAVPNTTAVNDDPPGVQYSPTPLPWYAGRSSYLLMYPCPAHTKESGVHTSHYVTAKRASHSAWSQPHCHGKGKRLHSNTNARH